VLKTKKLRPVRSPFPLPTPRSRFPPPPVPQLPARSRPIRVSTIELRPGGRGSPAVVSAARTTRPKRRRGRPSLRSLRSLRARASHSGKGRARPRGHVPCSLRCPRIGRFSDLSLGRPRRSACRLDITRRRYVATWGGLRSSPPAAGASAEPAPSGSPRELDRRCLRSPGSSGSAGELGSLPPQRGKADPRCAWRLRSELPPEAAAGSSLPAGGAAARPRPRAQPRRPRSPPGPRLTPVALTARPTGPAACLGAFGAAAKLPGPALNVQLGAPDVLIVREMYTLCRTCSSP